MESKERLTGMRRRLYEIIFEADTPAGKAFDLMLLVCIVASVITIMLDSVQSVHERWGDALIIVELVFTAIFTLEYIARVLVVINRRRYIFSFFGILDLIAILPTYLGFFFAGAQSLMVVRSIRLLRIFRILKLTRYVGEGQNLTRALKASQHKITVFLFTVLTTVIIAGAFMFFIEGPSHGFTSIPRSIYWAIVTMTTVGYGDIAPHTAMGQALASFIMIMGYGILAVPTGIVSAEMIHLKSTVTTQVCPQCFKEGHDADAVYCKYCGGHLNN